MTKTAWASYRQRKCH